MSAIVGFTGTVQAAPILLDALSKSGTIFHDSAGLAVFWENTNRIEVVKRKGKLSELARMIEHGHSLPGSCGIGQTRTASFGVPMTINAHPHASDGMAVVGVHDGLFVGCLEMKVNLEKKGYRFLSQTDSEVLMKLIGDCLKREQMTPVDAVARTMLSVRGSNAIAVMFRGHPGEIIVTQRERRMFIGRNQEGFFAASHSTSLLDHVGELYCLKNMEIAKLDRDGASVYHMSESGVLTKRDAIDWERLTTAEEKANCLWF